MELIKPDLLLKGNIWRFRFSGIIGTIRLQKSLSLHNVEIFEMNKDVGGTWFSNEYPGCACDIPIHGYCMTFEPRAGMNFCHMHICQSFYYGFN